MKTFGNSIGVWLLVMVAGLICAYWASIPRGADAGQRTTQNLTIDIVESLELSFGGRTVEARRENKISPRWWITNQIAVPMDGSEQSQNRESSRFLASEKFMDYLRLVATFPVIREIGAVGGDKLKTFGLDAPTGSIVLRSAGGVLAQFSIGRQPYGARSYYVMRSSDKNVFLVGAEIVDDFLKPESRFFERRVSEDALDSAQSIVMRQTDKTKTFVRLNHSESRSVQWVEKGSQTPAPTLGTWLEKFSEVRAALYVDEATKQDLNGRSPSLIVQSIDKKGNGHLLELFVVSGSDKSEYFVSSDFLGWPVKVASARAENLIKDAQIFFQN